MLWNDLGEANEDPDLESHQPMVLLPIPSPNVNRIQRETIMTHKKTGIFVTVYSSQLATNAIIFEATIVTTTNLTVSVDPHSRSR